MLDINFRYLKIVENQGDYFKKIGRMCILNYEVIKELEMVKSLRLPLMFSQNEERIAGMSDKIFERKEKDYVSDDIEND